MNVERYLAFFRTLEKPEQCSNDNLRLGFFEVILSLVMQGDLPSAWSILSEHSDLRLNKEGSDYLSLQDVFLSHPSLEGTSNAENVQTLSFQAWSALVHQVRSSQIAVVEDAMTTVFDVLEGNLQKPEVVSKFHCWEEYALCLLLYTVSSPYPHHAVLKAFDEAMAQMSSNDAFSQLNQRVVYGIIRGESGPLIRCLVGQHLSLSDRGQDGASLLSLLSIANLTQLVDLAMSAEGMGGIDGGVVWPQNDVGIVEELFLQSAELLNAVEAPLEVVISYCMACPAHGMNHAHSYIVHREIDSDESLMTCCSLLESLGLVVSCRVLQSSRGTWWLKTCGNRSKAIHFYCLAADYSRASALAEDAIWNLIEAVEGGGRIKQGSFKDLIIRCIRPSDAVFPKSLPIPTDEDSAIASLRYAVNLATYVLSAYENSSISVSYEKDLFFANTSDIFNVLRSYLNLIRGIVGSEATIPALIGDLLRLMGNRKVPLRFCIHFMEVCIFADQMINGDSLRSCCLKVDVESSLVILNRALSSPYASEYLADTSPEAVRVLSGRAVDLLARSIITSNSLLKKETKSDAAKDSEKPKSLMSCILAS